MGTHAIEPQPHAGPREPRHLPGLVWVWFAVATMLLVLVALLPWTRPESGARPVSDPDLWEDYKTIPVIVLVVVLVVAALLVYVGCPMTALVLALVVAVVAAALLAGAALNPSMTCWDGQDSQGRPTGGCYRSVPWVGLYALALTPVAAALGAVAALRAQSRVRPA